MPRHKKLKQVGEFLATGPGELEIDLDFKPRSALAEFIGDEPPISGCGGGQDHDSIDWDTAQKEGCHDWVLKLKWINATPRQIRWRVRG